jgi:hypothetical protein
MSNALTLTAAADINTDRTMYRAIRSLCMDSFLAKVHFDLRAHDTFRAHNGQKPASPADWIWAACMVAKDLGVEVTADPVGLAANRAEDARFDAIEAGRLTQGLAPTVGY